MLALISVDLHVTVHQGVATKADLSKPRHRSIVNIASCGDMIQLYLNVQLIFRHFRDAVNLHDCLRQTLHSRPPRARCYHIAPAHTCTSPNYDSTN